MALSKLLLLDALLALTLLLSCQIAAGAGELAAIRPGANKSGLGGFGAMFVLLPARWLFLALALAATAGDGKTAQLLAAHVAAGGISLWFWQRALHRVQHDHEVSPTFACLCGAALPAATLGVVVQRANPWLGTGLTTGAALVTASLLLHALPFHRRWRGR